MKDDPLGERCEVTDLHIIACGHCQGDPDAREHIGAGRYQREGGRSYGPTER